MAIGLVPAAGRGSRFGGTGIKELHPVVLDGVARPIATLALDACTRAGCDRTIVVISPEKAALVHALGERAAYVVQPAPRGLPDAIRCAAPWLAADDVALALPDTVILPRDAATQLLARLSRRRADLVLGVFPVAEPERLGPVDLAPDGSVRAIYDKPATTPHRNSWGMAAWSPTFTAFCTAAAEAAPADARERPLGDVFEAARRAGLRVEAIWFPTGTMLDIGTPAGLAEAERALAGG